MKKMIFTLLGLLMITSASAVENNYVPLVREGVKWVYTTFTEPGYQLSVIPEQLYSFEINGDTTINDKAYKHVYCTFLDKDLNPTSPSKLYCDIREENRVVYNHNPFFGYTFTFPASCLKNKKSYWPHTHYFPFWVDHYDDDTFVNTQEFVLYDFNQESYLPNLSVDIYGESLEGYKDLYRKDPELITVKVGNANRNAYIMNRGQEDDFVAYFLECKVIEGIGIDSRSGDLISPQNSIELSQNELMGLVAVYEGDELVYKGCLYDQAMAFSAINSMENNKQIANIRYYNLTGAESAEPQQGVNIKMTTYTDGTRSSEKVIK